MLNSLKNKAKKLQERAQEEMNRAKEEMNRAVSGSSAPASAPGSKKTSYTPEEYNKVVQKLKQVVESKSIVCI